MFGTLPVSHAAFTAAAATAAAAAASVLGTGMDGIGDGNGWDRGAVMYAGYGWAAGAGRCVGRLACHAHGRAVHGRWPAAHGDYLYPWFLPLRLYVALTLAHVLSCKPLVLHTGRPPHQAGRPQPEHCTAEPRVWHAS
jgi:hypothetical protein